MPSKRKPLRKRKPNHKNKRREVLRTVYYLASLGFALVRFFFFLWDRFIG